MRNTIAAVLLAAVVSTDSAPAGEPPAPVAGIVAPNVVVISPTLVTAGQPTRASLQGLKAEGYDAVISLVPNDNPQAVPEEGEILRAQGVEFVYVPIPWTAPEPRHFTETAAALDRLKGKKVLVHCQMNMRVSAMTFLYRTINLKEDPATAWKDVKKLWTPNPVWSKFINDELRTHGVAFTAE